MSEPDPLTGPTVLSADAAAELGLRFVASLQSRGITRGSVVAFRAANTPEVLAAIFGCVRAGYAPVALSAHLTPAEVDRLLADVAPAALLSAEDCVAMTEPAAGRATSGALDNFLHCRPLHFTSGTAGQPKAVWSGWLGETNARLYAEEEIAAWSLTAADVHLLCAPLSHSAPLRFALLTLLVGGSVVLPPKFDAPLVRTLLEEGHITTTFMAPTHLQRLLAQAPPLKAPDLRLLAHAGSACPEGTKREAIERFGIDVVTEFYGSTEGQFTVCPSAEWVAHPGTVGRARPGRELRIVDGVIWCKTPAHARFEYWRDPAKNAESWDGHWFTVGDLGRLDEEGFLYLEGRRGDLIITGGVNVYPAEVERVLSELAGVDKVCVFGIDDPDWGTRVCAAISGTVSETSVREYAASNLAPYKRPKTIVLVPEFPLTHSGKVDRKQLPALLPSQSGSPRPGHRGP